MNGKRKFSSREITSISLSTAGIVIILTLYNCHHPLRYWVFPLAKDVEHFQPPPYDDNKAILLAQKVVDDYKIPLTFDEYRIKRTSSNKWKIDVEENGQYWWVITLRHIGGKKFRVVVYHKE